MVDVEHEINAESRSVGTRTLESGEARVLTLRRTYPTTAADLWDALTDPQRIPRWFLPISGDLRVGGHYQFEGNAGGTVTRCEPPTEFAATWEFGGNVSWIVVRVVPVAEEETRFELEHVALVDDEMWAQFGPGAVGVGWDSGVLGLGLHVTAGRPSEIATEYGLKWMASDEGRAFIVASSDAWRAASVAAGTPEEEARAAAERTTAAYTEG